MPPTPASSRTCTVPLALILTLITAATVVAASLSITRASFGDARLYVAGTGSGGATVTIANAATGAVIGTSRSERNGRWKASFETLTRVPCRVRATQGTSSVERAVSGAPSDCDNGTARTLATLAITGPSAVAESSTAIYAATAGFSDGTTQNVTAAASWSESSTDATIAGGVLTTGPVAADQSVTITSTYSTGGVTRTATLAVTIRNTPAVTGSHAGRFAAYEGTKTCLTCHESAAIAFHGSVHYQWSGDASESTGLSTPMAGKMGGINDFCIYPDINWLKKLNAADGSGQQVDGGCARCHTGLGLRPSATATREQLENIDCLICHAPGYKRTLELVNGSWMFAPDTAKMTVSLLQAAVDLRKPGKDACLNCHSKAGGGDNFKRGDLSEAHRSATTSLDVHLAPASQGGAGLECTGCHTTIGHRIAGRGVDMRERDTQTPVECSNCHSTMPHDSSRLNSHTARVACNVCHVPVFAKAAPTDMRRDWSLPGEVSPATRLWEPNMVMQTNVSPVYRFFNGRSRFYEFGTPAVPDANGRVLMAGPLGSRNEPGARITAMKRHEGRQPIDPVTRVLLPLKIGIFFETGVVADAVTAGVAAMPGWPNNGFAFAETERYMGVYHEVAPKEQALACSSCHGGRRLDFAALGYTPLATRNGKPLCASCHSAESGSFTFIHDKHVTDRKLDCSNCHTFTKG
jgi:hypothetical protein